VVVRVSRVVQGGVPDVGEKEMPMPAGRPKATKRTACALPEIGVAVTAVETEAEGATESSPPVEREKP
jgi:hypothetical protein